MFLAATRPTRDEAAMPDLLFSLIAIAVIATMTPGGATTLAAASSAQFGFVPSIPLIGGTAFGVPIRKPEPMMQGFRSWSGLRRFAATFSALRNHFVPSPPLGSIDTPSSPDGDGGM